MTEHTIDMLGGDEMAKKKITDGSKKIVPEEQVTVQSFKAYASSDDEKTKIINGEKVIEDFHVYESAGDDDDDMDDDEDDE